MRVAHLFERPVEATYVVPAPRSDDALGLTLRAAYRAPEFDIDPFADVLAMLDTIEPIRIMR